MGLRHESPGKVYPRECGGTLCASTHQRDIKGLSPRVRGNPVSCWHRDFTDRSIPASAGEPWPDRQAEQIREVYPRECGGTTTTPPTSTNVGGLSPRVRGNRQVDTSGFTPERSIPASAGEPKLGGRPALKAAVYPRECGGTSGAKGWALSPTGLSPRVRGNLLVQPYTIAHQRSIPASAGEPVLLSAAPPMQAVYPRECGGTGRYFLAEGIPTGLSPRVRGNRRGNDSDGCVLRSIPASAGEPVLLSAAPPMQAVYPRECGGTEAHEIEKRMNDGLSPRVRGNLPSGFLECDGSRSIPASAGEPANHRATGAV